MKQTATYDIYSTVHLPSFPLFISSVLALRLRCARSRFCRRPALLFLWLRVPPYAKPIARGGSWVGRSPTPDRRSLGRVACARYPLAVGAAGVGVGTRHQPLSARSCELALRAVGSAQGRPGGGVSCLGVGPPGLGAPPRPTARLWGVPPGPVTLWLWVWGMWA